MSTISPQESQYYKELVTPFQPQGRSFLGYDLRGTQCDRFGNGNLRLTGYGDSSGGYAFTPANQDAAIAPSLSSANLSNIANSIPRLAEQQDFAGKWIDTITLHALDEFIEQVEPQSFIANTLRIFAGGQKGYREDGTGKANIRNTYTLLAEIPIPALTRADIPRSFNVKAGVYVPPAQNLYLGLAIPQPYTCSFEMWDLQANTLVGSGISASIGGSSTVADGNDLIDENPNTPVDTQFVLPLTFASATWRLGAGSLTGSQYPPTPFAPLFSPNRGLSLDKDLDKPDTNSPSQPESPGNGARGVECECLPPASRYLGWFDTNIADGVNGLFSIPRQCVGGKPTFLVGYSAAYMPNDSCGAAVGYWGRSSYCPWDESVPPPPCTLIPDKWKCENGNCVQDALGIYNSEAECQAALIPPQFSGGQCAKMYSLSFQQTYADSTVRYYAANGTFGNSTPPTITQQRSAFPAMGPVSGFVLSGAGLSGLGIVVVTINGVYTGNYFLNINNSSAVTSTTLYAIVTVDGSADNCGNPPSTCP